MERPSSSAGRHQAAWRHMMAGLTFDTGALIALERHGQRIARIYTTAVADGLIIAVPSIVIVEWWRGRSG